MTGFIPKRMCVQIVNLQDVDGVEQKLYIELRRQQVDVKAITRLVDESYKEHGSTCSAYVYLWDAEIEPHIDLAKKLYGQRFAIFGNRNILRNDERVLFTNVVPARNLPAIVETLEINQGITFKAWRRRGSRKIVRVHERVFYGDNDDFDIELLTRLQTEHEQRQRDNHARQETNTRQRMNVVANTANMNNTANAANVTDVNNNDNNNDNKNDGDDDVKVIVNNNNNNSNVNKDDVDDGTDDDGKSDSGESDVTMVPTSNASVPDDNIKQPLTQDTADKNASPTPSSSTTATSNATDDTTSTKPTSSSLTNSNNKSPGMMAKFYNSFMSKKQ
jgi:hypothetical protein